MNLCIRLCSVGKLLFLTFIILTKSVVSDMKFVFLSLHLLLLWTCAFAYAQRVSYFTMLITFIILTKSVVSGMKFVFLFLHLLLLWTCAFVYAQLVSYFSLFNNFYHSDKKCGEWHEICFPLSPFATSVNLCIRLFSVGKLLCNTS